jgi:hypothetical protein
LAHQTALFCREEPAPVEVIEPDGFRGFGHELEKAYTINQVQDGTGHHRVISYRFGGLSFVVRHGTDGFVDDPKAIVEKDKTGHNLGNVFETLSLTPETVTTDGTLIQSKLTVKMEGQTVPLESTLEIRTRVVHKPLELSEVMPQLWISQTPKLVRAYH